MGAGRLLRLTRSGNNWGQEKGVAGVQELQNLRPPLADFQSGVCICLASRSLLLVLVVVLRPRLRMEEG
jgi:hypothetical protein